MATNKGSYDGEEDAQPTDQSNLPAPAVIPLIPSTELNLDFLPLERIKYLLLFVFSLILMAGIACAETGPTVPPTPIVVIDANLRSMLSLVESNKLAAEATYKGKWVEFSGKIGEIKEDKFDLIPTDSDVFQMSGAECQLTKEEQSKVIGLRADQRVTVKGQVKDISTFMLTTFKIDKCQKLSGN